MKITRKQFDILCDISEYGTKEMLDSDEKIENYLMLVKMGYLKKLLSVDIMWDCKFALTEKAEKYLE